MLNGMCDVNPEAAASKDNSEEGSRVMPSEPVAFCIGSEEGSREMPLEPVAFCIGAELAQVRAGLSFHQVFKKGASERAGVVVGDVLLTLNEKAVSSLEDVKSNLMLCSNDNSVRLTLRSTDGSVCDRVLQCNTAVRQEPDACDRTPESLWRPSFSRDVCPKRLVHRNKAKQSETKTEKNIMIQQIHSFE